jgi:Short C-terminal domain
MTIKALSVIGLTLAFLIACGKPKVVPMEGDTYLVQERSAQVGFGPPEGAKAEVYQIANEFCANRNQVVETVAFNMVDSGFAKPGSVSLQFRCVNPNNSRVVEAKSGPASKKSDLEKKLEDLKDLFAKGLITKEDYDSKKKELLEKM